MKTIIINNIRISDILSILHSFKNTEVDYTNIEIHYTDNTPQRIFITPSSLRDDQDREKFKIDFDNINDYI